MLKFKPEETIHYIQSRLNKENKIKTEINLRNNNLLKNVSLYNTLSKFNVNLPPNNTLLNCINNQKTQAKENKEKNKEKGESKVLQLKKMKFDNNFPLFRKNYNRIDIDSLKKHLNLKKKKYNKGIDFCSYFLWPKNDYYINVLNEGITNNFISFFTKVKEFYPSDIQETINHGIDCNSFKINNIKYPMFIVRGLNYKIGNEFQIKNKEGINLYEKCINIIKTDENCENNFKVDIKQSSKTFLKGLNHNIQNHLENYLDNKIKLIDLNNEDNILFEKGYYLNKYQFQFIKKVNPGNEKMIDKSLFIPDKKMKYSFNEPRLMFPLFLKGLFDKINVYNLFSSYKNGNTNPNNSELNLFFHKNIDRPKEININRIFSEFQNSDCCSSILNGYYLINPFQQSMSDKEFIRKINISFLPKKLNKDLKSILGSKFNFNKYRKKRNYLNLINSQNSQTNKKETDKTLIIINKKTAKNYINNPERYIILDNEKMDFDILFDINICGKIYYASEFYDQFKYNGYNSLCDLINKSYLYYNKYYIFLIDDEKMNKNIVTLKSDKIMSSIYSIIDDKFGFLKNDKYQFNLNVKVVDNPHLINYEINHLYEEILRNNFNNEISVYNNKIIDRILNEMKKEAVVNKDENIIQYNNKIKYNIYEEYILNSLRNHELKEEIQNMIIKKYSRLNII